MSLVKSVIKHDFGDSRAILDKNRLEGDAPSFNVEEKGEEEGHETGTEELRIEVRNTSKNPPQASKIQESSG